MNTLRKLFATVVLTLVLSASTFSGEVSFPGARIQSTQQSTGEISLVGASSTTEIVTTEETTGIDGLDPLTESMLSLLQSLLLIF